VFERFLSCGSSRVMCRLAWRRFSRSETSPPSLFWQRRILVCKGIWDSLRNQEWGKHHGEVCASPFTLTFTISISISLSSSPISAVSEPSSILGRRDASSQIPTPLAAPVLRELPSSSAAKSSTSEFPFKGDAQARCEEDEEEERFAGNGDAISSTEECCCCCCGGAKGALVG